MIIGQLFGKPKKIDVPDPQDIINAEREANRVGVTNPFGSVRWEGNTQVTEFSPELQGLSERMFRLAGQDAQRAPDLGFLAPLLQGAAGNLGERYGIEGGSIKPQGGQEPASVMEAITARRDGAQNSLPTPAGGEVRPGLGMGRTGSGGSALAGLLSKYGEQRRRY